MTIEIPEEACEALMAEVRNECPDGGLSWCYDCARKAIRKVVSLLDIHANCVSLPNFTIDNTTKTGTSVTFYGHEPIQGRPCADGDFCKVVDGRIKHDRFCGNINHKDED
jgi:hypothetical protein